MILSFNASICLAYYNEIKSSDSDENNYNKKLIEKLEKSVKKYFNGDDCELKYDLGQMSIGKWNQISRDTSLVLFNATDNGKKCPLRIAMDRMKKT